MEYDKCLVQVDEVLNYLSEPDFEKIPDDIVEAISREKNKEYVWKYDVSKSLKEQGLDRKTIAILSYLNMEYLLNDKQKEYMTKLHEMNEQKLEQKKAEKYNPNELFKNIVEREEIKAQEENSLVVIKKEKWYKKIIPFIKNIFRR